ncbi:hypothetical protein MML48_6g00005452 [Holotrichia oblita]|uniref:Uncharacterized protein n=1 Tax=Holotrichia oblita TaxID=644536 RepID=A0ACB9SZ04_HOLOL|nr:hypothetical protein MML48_6g00005452 [Holotrichia oblita]
MSNTRAIAEKKDLIKACVAELLQDEEFLSALITKITEKIEKSVEEKLQSYEDRIDILEKNYASLEEKYDNLEQYSRRNSLRINGIVIKPQENLQDKLTEIFANKLRIDMDATYIDRCHTVGPAKENKQSIIIKFTSYKFKKQILRERHLLKGTGIFVVEDLTRARYMMYREAAGKFGPKNVWTLDGNIHIKCNKEKLVFRSMADKKKLACRLTDNMTDSRNWSKEVVTHFIEMYKSFPCLWKIKSRDYTNRNLKNAAYDKLVEFCKTINPEANRDFVVKKIQSFRGSFRKEIKRVEDSKRSGAGSDEIHSPTLWYFDLLLFTIDQELPAPSISIEVEELENSIEEGTQESEILEDEDNGSGYSNTQIDFINYCKTQLESNDSLDEFDATAIAWAKKLKRMNPTQAIYADMLINKIVNQGLLNQLTNNTTVAEHISSELIRPSPSTTPFLPLSPYT